MREYRQIDGQNNNLENPSYGVVNQAFLRLTPAAYANGIDAPSGETRVSARQISTEIFAQESHMPNPAEVSDLFWLWGQFLDHDITLTSSGETHFPIQVPIGDHYFDPYGTGSATIDLTRSGFHPETGVTTPAQQVNAITPFIDASNVYGSDSERQAFLRTDGGKLKVSEGNHLPYNDGEQENDGGASTQLFVAGDVRANENVGLLSLHTIFVREHNHWVDELKLKHPEYDDETLYQEAKKLVSAEIQAITYQEFLPLLLGSNALPTYTGYDVTVDPQIANIFATAAYRIGHTLLSSQVLRVDEAGAEIEAGHLSLREAFFRPDQVLQGGGVDPILRGAATQVAESLDTHIVDDVRNFLFGPPGAGGLDLAALNIQRGRDHGLADYNSARVAYGLTPVTDFNQITSDLALQQQLQSLYSSVNDIDVFVGGLAEDPQTNSMLGELFHTVILDQFTRLRDGDRFYYENDLTDEERNLVQQTDLQDIILRNTDIEHLQDNVMLASKRVVGSQQDDVLTTSDQADLVVGHDGHDKFYTQAGNDTVYAGDGYDHLHGDNGDDVLHGEAGRDTIKAGHGNDQIWGGDAKDYLFGETGNDTIHGGNGNDVIRGGEGDDRLIGGAGDDVLSGGAGDDTFVILLNTGCDHLLDFNPQSEDPTENDRIDLSEYQLSLEDILIESHEHGTQLTLPNEHVVIVHNVAPTQLTEADFIFA